jgi:hypothetical protein
VDKDGGIVRSIPGVFLEKYHYEHVLRLGISRIDVATREFVEFCA